MTRLSHSAKDKISTCGALYKYWYVDKIRPIATSSALFYGKALDEAFTALLETKLDPKPPIINDPFETFLKHFKTVEINGEQVSVLDTRCQYFKSDLDPDLTDSPEEAMDLLERYKILKNDDLKRFNELCVQSLTNKARILIQGYYDQVLPLIERVYSLQEEVNLKNDEGDEIIGFIDFICSFKDEPGVQYVVDNKTASKNYKEDSVRTSEQLATYCDYKLIDKAAYIVLNKTLRKKEPRVTAQIVRDTIPNEMFNKVFDIYEKSLYTIRKEEYYRNYASGCFFFGKKCDYYEYCRSNGEDLTGLTIIKKGDTNG